MGNKQKHTSETSLCGLAVGPPPEAVAQIHISKHKHIHNAPYYLTQPQ